MKVVNRIAKLLNDRNVSLSEVAKGAGIPTSTLSDLINNPQKSISNKTIGKLTDFLKCSVDELYEKAKD